MLCVSLETTVPEANQLVSTRRLPDFSRDYSRRGAFGWRGPGLLAYSACYARRCCTRRDASNPPCHVTAASEAAHPLGTIPRQGRRG